MIFLQDIDFSDHRCNPLNYHFAESYIIIIIHGFFAAVL
jgi:hypothetical protein